MANPEKFTKDRVELGVTFKDNSGYVVFPVIAVNCRLNDGNHIAQFRGPEAEGNALRMIELWNNSMDNN